MPYYSFNIKKGKYYVEMKSDDIYFAIRQVDRLFEKLLKTQGRMRVVLPEIEPEKIPVATKETKKQNTVTEPAPKIEEAVQVIKIPEPLPEPVVEQEEITEPEGEVVVEKIVEKAVEVIEEAKAEEEIPEVSEEEIQEAVQGSLFENILAEKTQEIIEEIEDVEEIEEETSVKEDFGAKKFSFKNIISEKLKGPNPEETPVKQKAGFKNTAVVQEPEVKTITPRDILSSDDEEEDEIAEIIEEKIKKSIPVPEDDDKQELKSYKKQQSLPSEPDAEKAEYEDENSNVIEIDEETIPDQHYDSLEELIAAKNPQSKLDYLLLTAYFLQTNESLFKYSLKQLNSKAMPFLGSLIDHSIIHNAVAHDFMEVVPDYNGTAEVTEYKLTQVGENYLLNEL